MENTLKPKKKKISTIILVIIFIVVCIAAIFVLAQDKYFFKKRYEVPLYKIINGLNDSELIVCLEGFPELPEEYEYLATLGSFAIVPSMETSGYTLELEVLTKTTLDKDTLSDECDSSPYIEVLSEDVTEEISKGYLLDTTITATNESETNTRDVTFTVVKINHKWAIINVVSTEDGTSLLPIN